MGNHIKEPPLHYLFITIFASLLSRIYIYVTSIYTISEAYFTYFKQSAQSRTGNDSVLFVEWELMVGYHVVALSSIVESLFVLELGSNRIAVALSYSEWPSCFTDTNY
jgi:hypothetical protein